jgi:hypothetical protein
MNRTLMAEEINWLRTMRDAKPASNPTPNIPVRVALKLKLLGFIMRDAQGEYTITMKGRDELIERERESTFS